MEPDFTIDDFRRMLDQTVKNAAVDRVLEMLPAGYRDKQRIQEADFERLRRLIDAMTEEERSKPEIMDDESRRARIALASGTRQSDVTEFLNQFHAMRELMRRIRKPHNGRF